MTHYLETLEKSEAREVLYDRWKRLNSLYYIKDEKGNKVLFRANEHQTRLYRDMHYLNIILKARQLGFTTFIDIFMLDAALFNSNMSLGIIADRIKSAQKIFAEKIEFPYDNLPEYIKNFRKPIKQSTTEIAFDNGSSIYVDTSMRGGTLQMLHISEYGKMCAKTPQKANEVKTGALNTLASGQMAFIESTAEGQEGHFHELSMRSLHKAGQALTPLDYRFFFYPWWEKKKYALDPMGVHISPEMDKYFSTLTDEHGIILTPEQKAWYVKKEEDQQEFMTREFPSFPEEAFKAAVEGSIFGRQMNQIEKRDQITKVPYNKNFPVYAYIDIGMHDYFAMWYVQFIGGWAHHIKYFEGRGISAPIMKQMLDADHKKHGMQFIVKAPFDVKNTDWITGVKRIDMLRNMNVDVEDVHKVAKQEAIETGRLHFARSKFDREACSVGLMHLRGYRFDWDDNYGRFKDTPRHDQHSHGADAFMYEAVDYAKEFGTQSTDHNQTETVTEYEDTSFYDDNEQQTETEGYYA